MRAFDTEIKAMLENTYRAGVLYAAGNGYTPDQFRMALVVVNLKSLVTSILLADTEADFSLDLKQMALGILGTIDFLEDGVRDLGPAKKEQ